MKVRRIVETCLYVDDLAVAKAFYERVLGLEAFAEVEGRHVFFRCGDSMLLLFNPDVTLNPAQGDLSPHGARGPGHIAFEMTGEEVDAWREHLGRCGVEVEDEVTWPSGGHSIYFRDPSGNSLEFVTLRTWGIPG